MPDGWAWSTLGEVCSKVVDGDHNPPPSEPTPTEYLMISSKNVLDSRLDELKEVRYLSRSVYEECNKRTRLMRGDILLTTVGTLGRSCIYDGNRKIVLQRSVSVLTPLVSSEYIKCYLDSGHFQRHIDNNARGTAQKGFYLNLLEATILPIPPLNEQQLIVAKASSLLSELNRIDNESGVIQDKISQTKSRILDLAIHGKLVPQDSRDEPAIEHLKHIKPGFQPSHNLHYGATLPNGWVCGLYGVLNQHRNKSINPMDFPKKRFELYSVPIYETGNPEILTGKEIGSTKQVVNKGDVLLCKINPHLNRSWVVVHQRPELQCIASSEWLIFQSDAVFPDYARIFFMSPAFRELMLSNVSGVGGSLMRARASAIDEYPMWIPPFKEQKRIAEVVKAYYNVLDEIVAGLN